MFSILQPKPWTGSFSEPWENTDPGRIVQLKGQVPNSDARMPGFPITLPDLDSSDPTQAFQLQMHINPTATDLDEMNTYQHDDTWSHAA